MSDRQSYMQLLVVVNLIFMCSGKNLAKPVITIFSSPNDLLITMSVERCSTYIPGGIGIKADIVG